MTDLAGKTVLVTGANRGVGREFVRQFLDGGAARVYAGARNPDAVDVTDERVVPVASAFKDSVTARQGAIVNVSSVMAWIGLGHMYSVSKAALWSANDAMRFDLAPHGVQVLGVFMGYVDTDMTEGVTSPKSSPAEIVGQVLAGLASGAEEVLADQTARFVRSQLHLPSQERYASLRALV